MSSARAAARCLVLLGAGCGVPNPKIVHEVRHIVAKCGRSVELQRVGLRRVVLEIQDDDLLGKEYRRTNHALRWLRRFRLSLEMRDAP